MNKKTILTFISGFLICFLLITTVRLFTMKDHDTHYHANMAIFIDGKRVDLSDGKYSEEISACSASEEIQPRQRTHLHQSNQDVVHVHHDGVTWGHLFSNLGFSLNQNFMSDDKGNIYKDGDNSKKLTFILNGKVVFSPYNQLIKSTDRLLINYGTESEEELTNNRFKEVANNADEFNKKNDPASCSGSGSHDDFWGMLKKAILN